VIAQSGKYPTTAQSLILSFKGEKRYWWHAVCFTGEIIDQDLDAVYE